MHRSCTACLGALFNFAEILFSKSIIVFTMSTPKERQLAEEAKKFYELKQKVVKYYQNNGVPKKMEDVLNDMYYDNPVDVYGYLSNVFANHSKPSSVTKVKAREALDSKGQPTLQTDIYCLVKNIEKIVASCVVSSYGYVLDGAKVEEKEEEDKWRQEMINSAVEVINGELCEKLCGIDPTKLRDADTIVTEVIKKLKDEEAERVALEKAAEAAGTESPAKAEEDKAARKAPSSPKSKAGKSPQGLILPDEPREIFLKGSNSLSALSQALCKAGAEVQDIPLYQHIAQTSIGDTVKKFKLPLPMVTIIQAGRGNTGKFRCVKDFMIVPSPAMSLKESVKHLAAIYSSVANSLVTKYGPGLRNTSDVGALCPALERVEQGLDVILEGLSSVGLSPGTDFNIVLNCAAHELFDLEKGKYEASVGGLKGPEDMVDFWVDLLHRYPAINGLIDPLRKRDTEQWNKLCEKVSSKCYVIGDAVYHRPGLLKSEEVNKELQTSGVVLRLEQMNTVSDIITCTQKLEETSNQVVLSTCQGETTDDFLADLAVGVGARFLKIGAPCRGERVSKLNRLLQIEDILESSDCLETHSEHNYPNLTVPPSADVQIPEEEATEGEVSEKTHEAD